MQFLKNIIKLFKKPFPIEESKWQIFKVLSIISVFVIFFLYVFEPFDIDHNNNNQFIICVGFGLMTLIASSLYEFIITPLIGLKSDPVKFTFGKWILHVLGIILCIGISNFLFARFIFFNGDVRWEFLPYMMHNTLAIGIFPVVTLGALALIRQEKKYQNIAKEINQQEANQLPKHNNLQKIFEIPVEQIKYIEALQNYVKIGYLKQESEFKEITVRATLKGIMDELNGSSIVKCHRSFLVNRDAINKVSGNAQGLILSLSECDKSIPVSRSWVAVFKESR